MLTSSPALTDLQRRFRSLLESLGLQWVAVQSGTSFKLGRTTICRIDPKPSKGILRVEVGEEAEERAPKVLVGPSYKQKGWLAISPEQGDVGLEYVEACVRRRLAIDSS